MFFKSYSPVKEAAHASKAKPIIKSQDGMCIADSGENKNVRLVEDSPSVSSLGRQCDELGDSYSWEQREHPTLTKRNKSTDCHIENFVPLVAVPG